MFQSASPPRTLADAATADDRAALQDLQVPMS
jgi:hypothetical protein